MVDIPRQVWLSDPIKRPMYFNHIRNLTFILAVIFATGCESQNARSSMSTSNAAAEAYFQKQAAENPILPDADLIKSFKKHRAIFEQVVQMITTDPKLHRVDCDWTDPQDPKAAGVSLERIAEYRRLLDEAGCHRGFISYPDRQGIRLISAAQGTVAGSVTQGFYYCEGAPDSLVANTIAYKSKQPGDSYEVFRHIEGNWFIYLDKN